MHNALSPGSLSGKPPCPDACESSVLDCFRSDYGVAAAARNPQTIKPTTKPRGIMQPVAAVAERPEAECKWEAVSKLPPRPRKPLPPARALLRTCCNISPKISSSPQAPASPR